MGQWAKRLVYKAAATAAPAQSPTQYIQSPEKFNDKRAGAVARAGLKAPPETVPPRKHRKPRVSPIAMGAKWRG